MIGNLAIKLLAPLLKMIFPKIDAKLKEQRQEIIEHIFKIVKIEENKESSSDVSPITLQQFMVKYFPD